MAHAAPDGQENPETKVTIKIYTRIELESIYKASKSTARSPPLVEAHTFPIDKQVGPNAKAWPSPSVGPDWTEVA